VVPPESQEALHKITEACMLPRPDQRSPARPDKDERIRTAYWKSRLIPEVEDLAPRRAHLEAINEAANTLTLRRAGVQ
jgi:hypothetical protein